MGWFRRTYAECDTGKGYNAHMLEKFTPYWYNANFSVMALAEYVNGEVWDEESWSPSTNIADAMKMIDYICNRYIITKSEMPVKYHVHIVDHMGMGNFEEHKEEAETLPLAICYALLKRKNIIG